MQLTRRALYDPFWSKPVTKVAAEFQISDVGPGKICDRHRVPTPPRGYWAKIEVGSKVKQALFVEVNDPGLDRIEIIGSLTQLPEPVRELVMRHKAERAERKTAERKVFTPHLEPFPEKNLRVTFTQLFVQLRRRYVAALHRMTMSCELLAKGYAALKSVSSPSREQMQSSTLLQVLVLRRAGRLSRPRLR
ncbi:hypothetical protein [Microvirga calopogonii]|uniref:hypothetical protein n=1 Tax=Microvirga calopogonii TaxID=2078013 RepID=UPI000E0D6065|nr:hypothetical protein [Microvirga calopogonii]